MPLYFVTGVSGSGKSAVCRELKSRGYKAYDTDEDGLSKWQHNETGYVHPKSSVKPEQRTPEFLQQHSWNVPREEVESLARAASHKPVFLCGVADNINHLRDLFDQVFVLLIDKTTLKHRLTTRDTNDWGKRPHELQAVFKHQAYISAQYQKAGFIRIDGKQSIKAVVTDILAKLA